MTYVTLAVITKEHLMVSMHWIERVYRLTPAAFRRRFSERIKTSVASLNVITTREGFRMDLDPSEWLQKNIRAGHLYEPDTVRLIHSIVERGDTCIDVGSHVGYFSLICAVMVGPDGKVISIDPQPDNCAKCLRNALLNDFTQINVVNAAVGAADSLVTLPHQRGNDRSKLSLVDGWSDSDTSFAFTTALVTLDTLLNTLGPMPCIKLLKIDAENYEYEILLGARSVLPAVENIVIEIHPHANAEKNHATCELLVSLGFDLFDMSRNPWRLGQPTPSHNVWASRSRIEG